MASPIMPFGTGSHICSGVNPAHIIMRVLLLADFEVEAALGSMDTRDKG